MTIAERRMKIFNILQENKTVEVNELAKLFSVSTMTIRRDLAIFERQGLVTTSYGGACLNQGTAIEPSFFLKSGQMIDFKKNIGFEAAKLVNEGDSIIIDCGTTTLQLAHYIQDKKITVITNSLPVINYLQGSSKIKLIIAPGEYSDTSSGAISSMTIEFFQHFNVDKVFIGTQGLDIKRGATVPDPLDADVKNSLLNSAKQRILMVDHEKFGSTFLCKHADITDLDYIITDSETDKRYIDKFQNLDVKVLIAEPNLDNH